MLVTDVWNNQPGEYFCLATKDSTGRYQQRFFTKAEFDEVRAFVNSNRSKCLYWCPHGYSKPRGTKQNAVMPNLLWADLDEADPRKMDPKPTIAWETSPGRFHALWVTEEPVNESMNQMLSYAVDADPSGWDITQVLRIPGTKNYKYVPPPKVKVLWKNGPEYTLSDINSYLAVDVPIEIKADVASRIYKKYERQLTPEFKRTVFSKRTQQGKRSQVLWKLTQYAIEAGMSRDEIFEILRVSPWNKFQGKRNADSRLMADIDRAVNSKFAYVEGTENLIETIHDVDDEDYRPPKFCQTPMSQVEEEDIDWIWQPYVAKGEVTILEGDPGLGKSYLAQMLAGAICKGARLPRMNSNRGKVRMKQGPVIYFDLENSAASVTKPRLRWNGFENMENFWQEEQAFTLGDEDYHAAMIEALDRIKPSMVVFDTINTYIGKTDSNKGVEVTQAMNKFKEIASRYHCSVLVLRHLTKMSRTNPQDAIYRGQGSISFTGAARVVMTVGNHPEFQKHEGERVLCITKMNISVHPMALEFSITSKEGKFSESEFRWGGWTNLTSDEILSSKKDDKVNTTDDAKEFLEELLLEGPRPKKEVIALAENRSFSQRTIERAAKNLGVVTTRQGKGRSHTANWELPEHLKTPAADEGKP